MVETETEAEILAEAVVVGEGVSRVEDVSLALVVGTLEEVLASVLVLRVSLALAANAVPVFVAVAGSGFPL